jgi:hypothetical protein
MAEERKTPMVEVRPPTGMENDPPALANEFDLSVGPASPMVLEFYYISLNTYRRAYQGEVGGDVERLNDEHVVIRTPPVARVGFAASLAVELISQLYEELQEEPYSAIRQEVDERIDKIRKQKGA